MNKTKIFIWALYDFANSLVSIAFFLYFSQWLVIDRGVSDFWFNITLTIASALYILVGPVLGSIADKTNNKTDGIRITTVATVIFYLITGLITVFAPTQTLLAVITFTIGSAIYLLTFIYYNSFLKDIAKPEHYGIVSGWGVLGNYLGQIVAVLITLPFVTGKIETFGDPGRAQAFIPATLIFFILALPLLIMFKKKDVVKQPIQIGAEYRHIWSSFKELISNRALGLFLLAYFFFNDAVITASNNFPIYMERVYGIDDSFKSVLLILIMLSSAIGGPLSGWIADRIGFKKTLLFILAGWIVIFPVLALINSLTVLAVVVFIMGLWFGSAWTISRAMIVQLSPKNHLSQSYTYYTLMERFATFIGPISWGLIVAYGPHVDAWNYRWAAIAMAVFVLIGYVITKKLPVR